MKYNVGDKVRIKSLDWYNMNKDKHDYVPCGEYNFVPHMSVFCGKILTIDFDFEDGTYMMKEDADRFVFTDEMIEELVEEEMPLDIDDFQDDNEIIDIIDEYVYRLKDNEFQINLPEGYIFKDENGNEILTNKIILEKKKKEYPKTYEECCQVLGISDGEFMFDGLSDDEYDLFDKFVILKRCRDAYWKIAGEEMGLGKPWEPNWNSLEPKYVISVSKNSVKLIWEQYYHRVFAFPTAEMRDAFKENFGPDIEFCKEFL